MLCINKNEMMKNKLLSKKKIPVLSGLNKKGISILSGIAVLIAGAIVLKIIADRQSDERIPY